MRRDMAMIVMVACLCGCRAKQPSSSDSSRATTNVQASEFPVWHQENSTENKTSVNAKKSDDSTVVHGDDLCAHAYACVFQR
jgi:hypothetical protein